jgi:hypothetical protein
MEAVEAVDLAIYRSTRSNNLREMGALEMVDLAGT